MSASPDTKKGFSPAVLESRRRVVGLSRRLNKRNSFKPPVVNGNSCAITESSDRIRHNHKGNITLVSTSDSSLPNVSDPDVTLGITLGLAKSKATHSPRLTCIDNKVHNSVRDNNIRNNIKLISDRNCKNSTKREVPSPIRTNNIAPASSIINQKRSDGEFHEIDSSSPSSQHTHINRQAEAGCSGTSRLAASANICRPQQVSTPNSTRKRPQTQRNIFGKRFKTDFKSPVRNAPVEESKHEIEESVYDLRKRLQTVNDEINHLQDSGYKLEEVQTFMTKLHEYNELKDIGQFLIGQIAFKEGTTTKKLYERFGLNLED